MKRIFSFVTVVLCLCTSASFGQQTRVSSAPESKSITFRDSRSFQPIGADKDNLYGCLINHTTYTNISTGCPMTVFKMELDGTLLQKKELKDVGKNCILEAAFVNEKTIDLLVIQNNDGNLLHVSLDKSNLERTKEDEYLGYMRAVSPDKSWVVLNSPNNDGNGTTNLYSSDFELIWSKEVSYTGIIDIMVTEDAELVLLGVNDKEGLYFHIITEDNEEQYFARIDADDIGDLHLVGYKNGCIYAGGLTYHASDHKNPKDRVALYDGIYSLIFNTKTQECAIDREKFMSKDIDVILNLKSGKNAENEEYINHLPYAGKIAAPDVMALAYHYIPSVIYDGKFIHSGILFFGISDDGKIAWKQVIRRSTVTSFEQFVNQDLFAYNGRACVAFSANRRSDTSLDGPQPVENLKIGVNQASLVMVSVDKEGNAKKEVLGGTSNKCLLAPSALNIDNGKRHFFLNLNSKTEVITIE